jgi:hypothetical protein
MRIRKSRYLSYRYRPDSQSHHAGCPRPLVVLESRKRIAQFQRNKPKNKRTEAMKRRHEMRACIAAAETPPPEPPSTCQERLHTAPTNSTAHGRCERLGVELLLASKKKREESQPTGRPNRRSDPLESGVAGGGDQRGGTRRGRAVQRIELTDRSAAGGGRRLCPFPPPVSASSVALVGFGSVCCFGRGRGVVGGENEKRKLGWVGGCRGGIAVSTR